MSDNQLHIDTDDLRISLEGDTEEVEEAYEALRSKIVSGLEKSLEQSDGPADRKPVYNSSITSSDEPTTDRPDDATSPMYEVGSGSRTPVPQPASQTRRGPHFVVCTDLCYSLAPLERQGFEESILGDIVDYETLSTLYAGQQAARQLENQLEFGDTLWRELTSEGLAAISDVGDTS